MAEPALRRMSYADYLALERETGLRYEYLDGDVRAMSGGTVRHSALKMRLGGLVMMGLDGGPCMPFDSDLKVHIEASGLSTYPDITVVCGDLIRSPANKHALTNPRVLFEVLSPSTERWDRGEKFRHYQGLESLTDYVLVSTDALRVEHYSRAQDGTWVYRSLDGSGTLSLPDLGLSIDIEGLYAGIPEEPPEDAADA